MASAFGGQLKRSYRLSHRPVDVHFSSRKRIEHQAVSKMKGNAVSTDGQDAPAPETVTTVTELCQAGVPEGPMGGS